MAGISINLVVIRSPNIEAIRRFYEAAGITFQLEQHGTGPKHYAATLGETVLEIYPISGEGPAGAQGYNGTDKVRLGLRVDSLEKAVSNLVAHGGKLLTPPRDSPWGRRAVVSDPDNRRIELTESTGSLP